MRDFSQKAKIKKKIIGLIPTMGYLHEGHMSLVRAARKECDEVVVSIFVNPAQFGSGEDFGTYPRDIERDKSLLKKENVDILFLPSGEEMYPEGFDTFIENEGPASKILCGSSRPEHFKGVTTIVAKLFNTICPDKIYKDVFMGKPPILFRAHNWAVYGLNEWRPLRWCASVQGNNNC